MACSSRQADDAQDHSGEPQIEVTPEMIEAGTEALRNMIGDSRFTGGDDAVVLAVWRAMMAARLARRY